MYPASKQIIITSDYESVTLPRESTLPMNFSCEYTSPVQICQRSNTNYKEFNVLLEEMQRDLNQTPLMLPTNKPTICNNNSILLKPNQYSVSMEITTPPMFDNVTLYCQEMESSLDRSSTQKKNRLHEWNLAGKC